MWSGSFGSTATCGSTSALTKIVICGGAPLQPCENGVGPETLTSGERVGVSAFAPGTVAIHASRVNVASATVIALRKPLALRKPVDIPPPSNPESRFTRFWQVRQGGTEYLSV